MNKYLNYKNYISKLKYISLKILGLLVSPFENIVIEKYSKNPIKYQPVFIIGAPRTGSTILYQTLTNQLDVLYIDNLVSLFFRNFFFGFWLSNKLFGDKPHNCFKSNYGNTSACGLHAPSESGEFWYRWLPRDRHFIDDCDITENMIKGIRRNITAVSNYYDKPIIFKNLAMGQRLRLLKKCFPNAKFIFIKREPYFTIQSIIKARLKLNHPEDRIWSIMPKNASYLNSLPLYEQITKQVYCLEKQIVCDLKNFNDYIVINYKFLGLDMYRVVDDCKSLLRVQNKDGCNEGMIINISKTIKLPEDVVFNINQEIIQLDWVNYGE